MGLTGAIKNVTLGADLISSGDIDVSARNINQVSGEASGVAAGSKVGIGIALVINVVTDKTLATTKRNIRADGSVSFKAEGASGSSTTAKAGTNGCLLYTSNR